jgi:hypothetical protein
MIYKTQSLIIKITLNPKHRQNIGGDKILALTKYWRSQNIGGGKIFAPTEIIDVDKIPTSTKFPSQQNFRVKQNKTKSRCQQNVGADAEESPYCLSTASDFSQTSLKSSCVSLMVLISLHAVAKCGVWPPCSYGRTLSRTILACRTGL